MSPAAPEIKIIPPIKEAPKPSETIVANPMEILRQEQQRMAELASGISGGFNGLAKDVPNVDLSQEQNLLAELNHELDLLGQATQKQLEIPGEKPTVPEAKKSYPEFEENEKRYVREDGAKIDGLEARYVDERTNATYVRQQIEDFAKASGLKHEDVAELSTKTFDQESRKIIGEKIQTHIDTLLNSEKGRLNPEKHRLVTEKTQRYLDLMLQAQAEGDLPPSLNAQTVLNLAEQNVWTLAFQDRVASENLLGDHGIRHLGGHNITTAEALSDELVRNGQSVRAVDRLIMHQIMIDHDLGYAMDPVRQQINKGNFKADRGHNVLAAKYERQRARDSGDSLGRVFTQEQIGIIHEGILHHDSSNIDFRIGDSSKEARQENILSSIHTADNTHAFEDKLPELLYTHTDTLRIMRLMKTAGEIGDQESFQKLQAHLVKGIQSNPNFSKDDQAALTQAAQSLNAQSYLFSVGRICGNRPEFAIDNQGGLTITVQESAIHQEVVGLYEQESYDQLRKFIGDLTGKTQKDVDLNQSNIKSANGKLEIRVRLGEQKAAGETSDYQKRIESLVQDKPFQEFISGSGENRGDTRLTQYQANLQSELTGHPEGSETHNQIKARLEDVKTQRQQNLRKYLGNQP